MRFERVPGPKQVSLRRTKAVRPGVPLPEITTPTDKRPVNAPAARRERRPFPVSSWVGGSLLLSGLLFGVFLLGDRGFWELRRQRLKAAELQKEVSSLYAETTRLEEEVKRLKNDPAGAERVVREELNFARPGEVVLLLPKGWTEKAGERDAANAARAPKTAASASRAR